MHDDQKTDGGRIERRMGLVPLTLDKGVRTTAIGLVYGLDFAVEAEGFSMRVYFDHHNGRIRVLEYEASDYLAMARRLVWLGNENGFDKIFLNARADDWQSLLPGGFVLEGILRYYFGGEDAYVLSYFGSLDRFESSNLIEESELIEKLTREPLEALDLGDGAGQLAPGLSIRRLDTNDIKGIVAHYTEEFDDYPVPLIHGDYVWQCLQRGVLFVGAVEADGRVVSCGSAALNGQGSAEISDCSTLEGYRQQGLIQHVVRALEVAAFDAGARATFALARSLQPEHNRLFRRLGYEYSGRLLNHFYIDDRYEDMNVWTKALPESPLTVEGTRPASESEPRDQP